MNRQVIQSKYYNFAETVNVKILRQHNTAALHKTAEKFINIRFLWLALWQLRRRSLTFDEETQSTAAQSVLVSFLYL